MKKAILIGAASTVVVAGAVGAFFVLDKTPKEMYFLAEKTQLENTVEQFEEDFAKEISYYHSLTEQSYSTTGSVALGVESETLKNENPGLYDLLNNLDLNVEAQQDIKKDKVSMKMDLANKSESMVGFDTVLSGDQIAVKLPGIIENYLYLNTADYGKFMKNQDETYDGKETLEFSPTASTSYQMDEELIQDIQEEYGEFIFDSINEDSVTLEKVDFNGDKAKKLTFTMDESEMKTFSKNVLTKLKADTETVDRIAQSLEDYYSSSMSFDSLSAEEELNKEFFKKDLLDSIDVSLKSLNDSKEDSGSVVLTSTITVLDKEIVERNLSLVNGEGNKVELNHTKNETGGKLELIETDASVKDAVTEEVLFSDLYTFERQNDGFATAHNVQLGAEQEGALKLSLDMVRTVNGDDVTTELTVTDDNKFTYNSNSAYNMTDESVKGTAEVNLDITDFAKVTLSSVSDIVFTDELEFAAVDEEKDTNLATVTETEKMELLNEAQTKALAVYMKYAGLFMPNSSPFMSELE